MAFRVAVMSLFLSFLTMPWPVAAQARCRTENTVVARVAAIDQAWVWNRYGAIQPHGMMFALLRDVWSVDSNGGISDPGLSGMREAGKVTLRPGKRPRPLVLRVNKGDCLQIELTNLLDPERKPWQSNAFRTATPEHQICPPAPPSGDGRDCADGHQPSDRWAGLHVTGLAPDRTITDMAQHVGANPSSLAAPGETKIYRLIAEEEGTFFAYSPAATVGSDGNGGAIHAGLFAAVTVEPKGAVWYRSQITEKQMTAATSGRSDAGQPLFADYARFAMLDGREIVHSDLTAIVDMRKAKPSEALLCLDREGRSLPVCGDRSKSFREFTVIFHDESGAVQAFKEFEEREDAPAAERALARSLHGVRDGFAINYGTAGAGAEVLANRKKLGPVKDCVECQMEEFFLSSWAVGDPAMIVDKPANMQAPGQVFARQAASFAYFPDDPSNVYHSYLGDRVVIRNIHAGPKEHHVFHLHAHQWLQTQANTRSPYLDSQTIGPGGAYSYEIAYGGSGNRNLTAGDSIFHCHFYPHFAQGMWALWRVHDTFEPGTALEDDGRRVKAGARALPDGEITTGTPIPALVPLPDIAMAPMPGQVTIGPVPGLPGGQIASTSGAHPGYPFYYPANAGHRAPAPPLDVTHDGGLERHTIAGGAVVDRVTDAPANLVKDYVTLKAAFLPEDGTAAEKAAMAYHAASHSSVTPSGGAASFVTNGRGQQHGAPFADPCRPADGWGGRERHFQIGAFQYDMVLNKKGWHFPQARILALREDIEPTLKGTRLPQPLFFRVNSGDCVEVEHTNVVPLKMVRDAFQLQVPTDIIGQHIHLVKFDVQASDGGANGFNYEDGTPAAQEVVKRIAAIRRGNGCADGESDTTRCPVAKPHPWFPGNDEWVGGQITVQRWFADPQEALPTGDGKSFDKTLETVFTHDHFGASNHQQVGLYAGLIVEPKATRWFDDIKGDGSLAELGTRTDGGPTSWKAMVLGADPAQNFREFALEYQDFHLAFTEKDRFVRQADGTQVQVNGINMPHQVADAEDGDYIGSTLSLPPRSRLVKHEWLGGGGCTPLPPPCAPEIVSSHDVGVMSINYRAEPLSLRLANASGSMPATGVTGDLAHAFRSISRADATLNQPIDRYPLVGGISQPSWPLPTPGMKPNDPFTPMLELMEREPFRIRLLAGAHEHEHSFTINGLTWLAAPHEPNSGYRSFVGTALSEHFEFDGVLDIPSSLAGSAKLPRLDHLYRVGASIEDVWYGNWGLIRTYRDDKRPKWLPTLADAAAFAGGAAKEAALADAARIERAVRAGQAEALEGYAPASAPMLAQLVTDAGALAQTLLKEARGQGLIVETGAPPSREEGQAFVREEAATDATFVTDVTRRKVAALGGAALAGRDPAAAERRRARMAATTDARATPRLLRDGYYDRAVQEAAYEEMIETLVSLQLDAASYLETPNTLLPGRQPGVRSADIARFKGTMARVSAARGPAIARLDTIRARIPRLVDLSDLQSLPVCAPGAAMRYYWVAAIDAKSALADGAIVYHRFANGTTFQNPARNSVDRWKQVSDPTGLLYVRATDLDAAGRLRADRKVEPLILHARAGECLKVLLTNVITHPGEQKGFANLPAIQRYDINDLRTTDRVGIHALSLRKNVGTNDGINVGDNPVQTLLPGQSRVYEWYAGVIDWNGNKPSYRPMELGAVNLMPADPVKQGGKGLFGALVIQPRDATWGFDTTPPEPFSGGTTPLVTRASLAVFSEDRGYRDFVLVGQDDANLALSGTRSHRPPRFDRGIGLGAPMRSLDLGRLPATRRATAFRPLPGGLRPVSFIEPVRRVAQCVGDKADVLPAMCPVQDEEVDAVDAGHKAFNYRSEAGWMRRVHSAAMPRTIVNAQRQHDLLSDGFIAPGSPPAGPNQTPRFCALPGDAVRVRVLFPNGHGRNHVIDVAGHQWDDQPFVDGSSRIASDELSEWRGTHDVVGPGSNWNLLLQHGAGGSNGVAGDYAIRDTYSWGFDGGLWAVLRVGQTCGG